MYIYIYMRMKVVKYMEWIQTIDGVEMGSWA